MGWTIQRSNSGGGEIFPYPSKPALGPAQASGYGVYFPGVKRQGSHVNRPPQYSAEVKERVEVYLYSLYGLSWSSMLNITFDLFFF